jgi:hypothetical protein
MRLQNRQTILSVKVSLSPVSIYRINMQSIRVSQPSINASRGRMSKQVFKAVYMALLLILPINIFDMVFESDKSIPRSIDEPKMHGKEGAERI